MDVAIQTVRFSDHEDAKHQTVSSLALRPNLKKLVFTHQVSKPSDVPECLSFASSVTPDHERLQTARLTPGGRLCSSWPDDETLITQIPDSLFVTDQRMQLDTSSRDNAIMQIDHRPVRRNRAISLSLVSSDDEDYETDLEFDEDRK